jgi:hypothetical protein
VRNIANGQYVCCFTGVEQTHGLLFASASRSANMKVYAIPQEKYLEAAQLFHWATKEHYIVWLTGELKRHRRTEIVLPRLSKKWASTKTRGRSLFATRYGKRLVYACPRKVRNPKHILKIAHGLGCTEVLVRLWRSKTTAIPVEERHFTKFGCVPEFGLWYPTGKMILAEFSTQNDFDFSNKMVSKLTAYRKHLVEINARFKTDSMVVFVIDVPRDRVLQFVLGVMPAHLPVYFVDYETFKSVPLGGQLCAPIYIWGEDGCAYPLSQDA